MNDGWLDGWMNRKNEETNKQEEIRAQKDNCGESAELIMSCQSST